MEKCSVCGKTIENGCFGLNSKYEKVCYSCCAKEDYNNLLNLKIGETYCLYLTNDKLCNWPGSLEIPLCYIKEGFHNIARVQRTTWFNIKGNKYFAKQYGDNSEIAYIKRYKGHKGENDVPFKVILK